MHQLIPWECVTIIVLRSVDPVRVLIIMRSIQLSQPHPPIACGYYLQLLSRL